MSADLPRPDEEKLKSQGEQTTPEQEKNESSPCIGEGERPDCAYKSDKNKKHPCCNWKKWREAVFKGLEALAFIAIIFTFWEMRKTRIEDERAWVTVTSIIPVPSEERVDCVFFKIGIQNFGRTPALNTMSAIGVTNDISFIKDGDTNSFVQPNSFVEQNGIASPNAPFSRDTKQVPNNITDGMKYIKNEGHIYIFGIVRYDDIFKKPHWSSFCFTVDGDFKGCHCAPIGNDCDDASR